MRVSKPIMHADGRHVESRNGEFYEISSTYRLPTDSGMKRTPWKKIMVDVDELQNKPRRFFDTLLSLVEAQDIKNSEARDYLVRGCEMWLSAVENGLFYEVVRLSVPIDEKAKKDKQEFLEDYL